MKKTRSESAAVLLLGLWVGLVLLAWLCGGCAAPLFDRQARVTPIVSAATVTNYFTNVVSQTVVQTQTNFFTNTVWSVTEDRRPDPARTVTNFLTNFVFSVSTQTVAMIEAARQTNAALPSPVAPLVAAALALLSGVLGVVAKVKSNQAALLPAVIAGVEAANNAEVKGAIQLAARAAGVEPGLNREVRRLTV